jgi:hypothetical protein
MRRGQSFLNLGSVRGKLAFAAAIVLSISALTSCSSQSSEDETQASAPTENPLAELSFANDSSDAYKRACYWGSQGENIFLWDRIKEGNRLAQEEGRLPLAGLEQAMDTVIQKGIPQAPKEYEMVKSFCADLGFQLASY